MYIHFNVLHLAMCSAHSHVTFLYQWRDSLGGLLCSACSWRLASSVFQETLDLKVTTLDPNRVQNAKYDKLRYLVDRCTVEINTCLTPDPLNVPTFT